MSYQAPEPSQIERITLTGQNLMNKVSDLIHEGNVRRVTIKQNGETIVEFPLTIGVIGIALAPALAAVGAAAAMLTDCTLEIERVTTSRPVDETHENGTDTPTV